MMNIIKYPSENAVNRAISEKEPMLMLISFDGKTAIISQIDEAFEHNILLTKAGFPSTDIDKYFRIVLDEDGADWTFVCPPDYKPITDKQSMIKAFYKDGFTVISDALSELGFLVGINIPNRYRRYFD